MKKTIKITFCIFLAVLSQTAGAQLSTTAPYCCGTYATGQCNQPGPSNAPGNFINDFIDNFSTSGANTNISNLNSGCNAQANNCANHCSHYMAVSPGQTIVCTMSSGNTFAQGFAMFVDWDQDNVFNTTNEFVGSSAGVPAATTPTTITFIIPLTQPNGIYRMRVRCAFATTGPNITPCGAFGFGETEDYTLFVGPVPPNSAVPTGTALVNSPVCVGQALSFSFATTYSTALSYTWTGPASYSSTLQNPSIPNPTTSASGIYTVLVTNSICPITRTVSALVVPYPIYTPLAFNDTICQGGSLTASVSMQTNPTLFSYLWSSASPGLIFNPQLQSTFIQPGLLHTAVSQSVIVYNVVVSPLSNPACAITKTIGVLINNPLTPTLTMPAPLCNVFSSVQLTATPGGGTWSPFPSSITPAFVTLNGVFTPSLAAIGTNTVKYTVSAGICNVSNTATLSVSKFNTPALTSSISLRCVQDPLFNLMNIVQTTVTGVWSGPQVINNFFDASGLASGNYALTYNTSSTPIFSVCPSSTVLVVPVFNPPTPTINPIHPLCNNAGTVALVAIPQGGVWSGNSGITPGGIRTPSLNVIGTNSVMYAAGQGTCVAASSATFHVSQYNTAALSATVPHLCETNNPFNLMGIVQNTNGIWGGIGIYPTAPTFFDPSGLPTGIYTLSYTTKSTPIPGLCDDTTNISVSVLNPIKPIITQVGPFCSKGNAVQLSVSPATGNWVTTSYLSSSGVLTPSLCPIGNVPVQYVIGTSTCNAQTTRNISIEAFVSAAIISNISDQCNDNPPVSLLPITQNNSGSWSGPGIIGSSFNPASAGAGYFVLTHQTSSFPSGLCPDQATVAVQVFSLAPPSITKVNPLCDLASPIQLQVTPVGGVFGSGLPGIISPSGVFNPALGIIGDNFVNYTISVGPCRSYAQINISVEKFVSADFAKLPDVYCKDQDPINLNSFVVNPDGRWSGDGVVGNMFYPSLANIGPNNRIFYETNSANSLCPDASSVTIKVNGIPVVKPVVTKSNSDCAPVQIVMNDPTTNSGKGIWSITDGSHYEGLTANHIFTTPGSYTVMFTYSDNEAKGCSTRVVIPTPVIVYESPKADFSFSPDEVTIADPVVTLTNLSSFFNSNNYVWNVQGQLPVTDLNHKAKFTQPGAYKVTLTATNLNGCKDEVSKMIEVKNDFSIHIPDAFTPNFDGMNDLFVPVFTAYGLDTKNFDMEIFDRWGAQVFHTKDATKGWDGMIKGEVAKEGNYVYRIRYKDLDGKVYNKTGHLTLLR